MWGPRKIATTRWMPRNCLRMIPLCSRFDSLAFTSDPFPIGGEINFSRSPCVFSAVPTPTGLVGSVGDRVGSLCGNPCAPSNRHRPLPQHVQLVYGRMGQLFLFHDNGALADKPCFVGQAIRLGSHRRAGSGAAWSGSRAAWNDELHRPRTTRPIGGPALLSPFQSCPDYTTITSGHNFRKGAGAAIFQLMPEYLG